MLSVKHGDFAALEEAFAARLKEHVARGSPARVLVVAPSRRLADRLQRLVAVERGLPTLGVEFHTFRSLADAVLEGSGFPDLSPVSDPVLLDLLVDRLLDDRPSLASFFGGEARPKALAASLRASLRDLIDAGVSGDVVEEHFGSELLREPHERERLRALLGLARAYEERLASLGLVPPSGLVKLAAKAAPDSAFLKGFREILYYGFYDLTGVQLDFFEAVTGAHPCVVYFPFRRDHPAFRFAELFFEQKLGGAPCEELSPGPAPAVGLALDGFFGAGGAKLPPGKLSVLSASGARDEAWAAAKEILKLVESGGRAFAEIGVVARALEPYRSAIAEVFTENAIPFSLGAGEPLLRRPLAKAALNLLGLRRRDYPASAVEDLFGSPYFRPPLPARRRRSWRLAISLLGVRAGWLQWRGKLEGRPPEDLAPIPAADVAALWEWIEGLHAELGAPARGWAERAARARALLERHLAPPERAEPEEDAAWRAVHDALDELAAFEVLGAEPGPDEFLDALARKLEAAALDGAAAGRGVRVLDAMDARGESFPVLILIGLKEKLFPRLVTEDPLLRETARAALRHPAGYWIARKSAGYEEERLLFYLAAAAAREKLVCVYPRSDEAGKAEVPSLYLRELMRAALLPLDTTSGEAVRRIPRQPAEKLRACEADLLSPKELALREALDGRLPAELSARVRALNAPGAAGPRDGMVGPPEDHLLRLRREGVSPSALDQLAECPFQYFAGRVLGLSEREEAAEKGEFAAWARGKIYHAVLERFYAAPPEERGWSERLDAAVEAVFAENDWRRMGVYPLLWLSAKQVMTARLREFLAWDLRRIRETGLAPLWREKTLAADFPGAPAALAGLRLKGIVDRVDADASGRRLRVVDYKSRWRRGDVAKLIDEGRHHQLPVYADVCAAALEGRAEAVDACLCSLEDSEESTGLPRCHEYPDAARAAGREAFFAGAAARLDGLAAGRFPIRPDDGEFGHCRWCEFSPLCRKSHGPSRRRAAQEAAS